MTDVLIRNVPDDELIRIDQLASRLGLSRVEYLRRQISQLASVGGASLSVEDLRRAAELARDLEDQDVMRGAWS
jgi:hypothetical protein